MRVRDLARHPRMSAFRRGHPAIQREIQETDDIWIAASAMQHGLRNVTTDERYAKVPQFLVALHEHRSVA